MSTGWTAEQLAAIGEQQAELALSAAAGSGKTAVLIERVLRAVIGSGPGPALDLERLLVVTFTRAAAAELRERLQQALEGELWSRRAAGQALGRLREQLAALPLAQISTIHSFCLDVLRRYGHSLGLSGGRILSDDEARLTRHQLATELLDELLGADWRPRNDLPPLRELALAWGGQDGIGPEDLSRVRFAGGLRLILLQLHDFRCSLPDPDLWFDAQTPGALNEEHFDPQAAPLSALAERLRVWREAELGNCAALAEHIRSQKPDAIYAQLLERRATLLRHIDLSLGWDAMAAALAQFKERTEFSYKPTLEGVHKRDLGAWPALAELVEQNSEEFKAGLNDWRELFARSWAQFAAANNAAAAQIATLWALAQRFDTVYAQHKRGHNALDYADLERHAIAILSAGPGPDGALLPSAAALEVRARLQMVLVDEYQDTSPIQDALLELVTPEAPGGAETANGRPRFMVGDLKQSIYAFRLAEPGLFTGHQQRLAALPPNCGLRLRLSQNFRSRPLLLSAINHLFLGLMDSALGGEDYAQNQLLPGLDYRAIFTAAAATPVADQPVGLHLVQLEQAALQADAGAEAEGPAADGAAGPDEDSEPLAVSEAVYRRAAAVLAAIHSEGQLIYDKSSGTVRPVQWRDMAILLRSTRGRVELLKLELERAGVPCYAPGRSGFYERPEVADALSLLRVVDNPRQDVALAAVLRGPLLQLSPEELLLVAQPELEAEESSKAQEQTQPNALRDPLWSRLRRYVQGGADAGLRDKLAGFLAQLAQWRVLARSSSVPQLLARLLADSGLRSAAAALRDGGQRLANLQLLEDLAREFAGFERQGLPRFLDFLRHSRKAAGDLGEAPQLSEAANVVRVMTIHQSKGLEFPVVLIPDVQRQFNLQDLNADVLWQRQAGIGGRLVDLRAHPPQRCATLAWSAVREAKRTDAVSEELRVLYVALTRARERLELVAAVKPGFADKLPAAHKGPKARSWLDWLLPQLRPAVMVASETGLGWAGATNGAGDPPPHSWRVQLHGPAVGLPAEAAAQHQHLLSLEEAALLERRLHFEYAYGGSNHLPAKITVTRLAKPVWQPAEADAQVSLTANEPLLQDYLQPQFMRAAGAVLGGPVTPGRADIGTATHALLAQLTWDRLLSRAELAGLRDRLAAAGRIEASAAALIELEAIHEMQLSLWPLLSVPDTRIYRELPVALYVAPSALAGGGLPDLDLAHCAPEDRVYVQGVIDLLAVSPSAALLLDFKTDRASADELLRRYQAQLGWYAQAACGLLPQLPVRSIRWGIYGLSGAGLLGPFESVEPET